MVKIYMVICIFMTSFVVAKSRLSPWVSPSLSCSTAIYNMADCVQFLTNGSKEVKPAPSCCTGFEKVLKSNPECICESLKSSAQLGVNVNLKKAAILPSVCQISAPPLSQCGVSSSPGTAPASPPSSKGGASSTKSPPSPPGVPPPPAQSSAYFLSACFFVPISVLAVSLSYMSL